MDNRIRRRAVTVSAIVLIASVMFAGLAMAAEFSANVKQKMTGSAGNMDVAGKIYVKGMLQRQEMTTSMGKQIVIARPDKGFLWLVLPSQKGYMEKSIGKVDPKVAPSVASMVKQMPNARKIGVEKIAGYQCDKYKFADTKAKVTGTVSISPKLMQELRSDIQTPRGKMHLEVSGVKVAKQPDSLFRIPAGYKKMAMPQPGAPGGMGMDDGAAGTPPGMPGR